MTQVFFHFAVCFPTKSSLKDDDSGDHDQDQGSPKDSEKEKTEDEDKEQNSSKKKVSLLKIVLWQRSRSNWLEC